MMGAENLTENELLGRKSLARCHDGNTSCYAVPLTLVGLYHIIISTILGGSYSNLSYFNLPRRELSVDATLSKASSMILITDLRFMLDLILLAEFDNIADSIYQVSGPKLADVLSILESEYSRLYSDQIDSNIKAHYLVCSPSSKPLHGLPTFLTFPELFDWRRLTP